MSNPLLTEKVREHVAFTVIGLALAAIGTVGSLSLTYVLTYSDTLETEVRKEDRVFKEFSAKAPCVQALLHLVNEVSQRSLARSDKFLKGLERQKKDEPPGSLRDMYESSLREAMQDLAALSGYSPETTGLPSRFHEGAQAPLRAEIEFWRTVGKNFGPLESHRLSRAAQADLQSRLLDMSFASAVSKSATEDMIFDQDLRMKALDQQRDELRVDLARGHRWFRLAMVCLFVAILVFYFAFRVTILGNGARWELKSKERRKCTEQSASPD